MDIYRPSEPEFQPAQPIRETRIYEGDRLKTRYGQWVKACDCKNARASGPRVWIKDLRTTDKQIVLQSGISRVVCDVCETPWRFEVHPTPKEEYAALLRQHEALRREGKEGTEEARTLLDRMDEVGDWLTQADVEEMKALSVGLYEEAEA
jgi:hypothetical protein